MDFRDLKTTKTYLLKIALFEKQEEMEQALARGQKTKKGPKAWMPFENAFVSRDGKSGRTLLAQMFVKPAR